MVSALSGQSKLEGGGGIPYERGGMLVGKFELNPLKETNQPIFDP